MKSFSLVVFLAVFVLTEATGQQPKPKEVKRAVEAGKIRSIELVIEDHFKPGYKQEFDLRVQLESGLTVLASDYHVIWDYATVVVDNSPSKIRGEFLANGKGVLKPQDASYYYPAKPVTVTIELAGQKVSRELTPNYCYTEYVFTQSGDDGADGSSGTSGYSGGNGREGYDGHDGKP